MRPSRAILSATLAGSIALGSCRARGKAVGYVEPPTDGARVTCPVSGVRCEKNARTPTAVYEMRTFYFCTEEARARFVEHPDHYAVGPGP